MDDLIRRHAALDALCEEPMVLDETEGDWMRYDQWRKDLDAITRVPSADRWTPIKYHEITDEEREENGFPKDWVYYLDCEMPKDGQGILVTTKNGYVEKDVCFLDDGYGLDSGWDWREDVVAWMPLPEPWRPGND